MIRRIRKAAVIGSGVMGGGIAGLLASAGIDTLILDIVPPDLTDDQATDPTFRNRIVKQGFDTMVKSRPAALMTPDDARRITIGNLEDDFHRLADCDWIVEVVVENLQVKNDLLSRIESVRKADTIVSTNTSGIPLKAMSQGLSLEFRQHFMGTHFFNPVRYMRLLELIPGQDTLPEVLTFMADFGERRLGKGIVWAKDTPNFVGNRIGIQGSMKSMHLMVTEGLSIAEADAMLGPVLGRPKTASFKTGDLVGLDILGHVATNTHAMVDGDEAREDFTLPAFVKNMIEQNLLGKKTGRGFYKTDRGADGKKVRQVIDPKTLRYQTWQPPDFPCLATARNYPALEDRMAHIIYAEDRGARFAWQALAHNLVYAANRIPEIADTIVEIDRALKWGFNFELGPFESWDAIGVERSVARMDAEGIAVPDKIRQMLDAGHTCFYRMEKGCTHYFDFATQSYQPVPASNHSLSLAACKAAGNAVRTCDSASLVDIGDGIFCCEFHTKMNALNGEITEFLANALDYVDTNGIGMVIGNQAGGMPGAFSAGADINYLRECVAAGEFDTINAVVGRSQEVFQHIKYSGFPVVAAPYGMTLGGGCEICLAADRIVAHTELYMGLVEVGVGLLPAGGGCLNLWKRFINSLLPAMDGINRAKCFLPTFMTIAMAKVSTSAADARRLGFLGAGDRLVANRDHLIAEAKKEVLMPRRFASR